MYVQALVVDNACVWCCVVCCDDLHNQWLSWCSPQAAHQKSQSRAPTCCCNELLVLGSGTWACLCAVNTCPFHRCNPPAAARHARLFGWLAHAHQLGSGAVHPAHCTAAGRAHQPPGLAGGAVAGRIPHSVSWLDVQACCCWEWCTAYLCAETPAGCGGPHWPGHLACLLPLCVSACLHACECMPHASHSLKR